MSLRALFFLLLFGNLVFLAWARLIDVPADTQRVDSTSQLPRLRLANEAQTETQDPAAATRPAPPREPPASGGAASPPGPTAASAPLTSAAPAAARPAAVSPTSAAPTATAAPPNGAAPLVASSPGPTSPGGAAAGVAGSGARCITVGPFADTQHAGAATDLLRQRGFHPRQHADPAAPAHRYWVYVGGLDSYAAEQRAVSRLQTSGIEDAQAMPDAAEGRRVSVGLFSERSGAERRARAVRLLGFAASIEERDQSEAAHWVDVDLNSSTQTLPMDGLLSLQDTGSKLEVRTCAAVGSGNAVGAHAVARGNGARVSSKLTATD